VALCMLHDALGAAKQNHSSFNATSSLIVLCRAETTLRRHLRILGIGTTRQTLFCMCPLETGTTTSSAPHAPHS
jgi:hypothetical protein